MNDEAKVIWTKDAGDMPEKAKCVVDAARGELLLRTLGLPENILADIRYNAEKNEQTIHEYVSGIVVDRLRAAS